MLGRQVVKRHDQAEQDPRRGSDGEVSGQKLDIQGRKNGIVSLGSFYTPLEALANVLVRKG